MPKPDTEVVQARSAQRKASKRATFDLLASKKRAERELTVLLPVEGGKTEEVSFLFRAIGARDWDKLVSKFPPTTEQRADGASFNMHTFAPALLAATCADPEMSEAQWKEIWESPDWNRGEIIQLYATAVDLCSAGMDIPFSGRD